MKDAVPLEQVAADIDPLMTGNAAERLEQLIAAQLFGRQRCGIAAQPAVEPASGGHQRSLIGRDGIQEARTVRGVPVGGSELTPCLRLSIQLFENRVDACPQALRTFQRCLGVRLERTKFPFPVETKAENRVEDGAGIDR